MQGIINTISEIPGLVIFTVFGKEYCMDVKDVKFIVNQSQVFSGQKFNREIFFSGYNFKVVDFHSVFSGMPDYSDGEGKVLLCKIYGKNIALVIDEVIEFLTLDSLFVQQTIDLQQFRDDCKKWVLKYQDRNIFFPDYEYISKNLDILQYK